MSETKSVYAAYAANTHLFGGNGPYVEEMYENYLANPGSVPDNWREYFDALQHVPAVDGSNAKDVPHLPVINAFADRAKQGGTRVVMASADAEMGRKRTAVQQLIAAYRNVGQRWADLDPLKRTERPNIPDLDPAFYGFTDADQETVFDISNTFFGKDRMSLRELLNALAKPTAAPWAPSTCTPPSRRKNAGGNKSSRASAASRISAPKRRNTSWTD